VPGVYARQGLTPQDISRLEPHCCQGFSHPEPDAQCNGDLMTIASTRGRETSWVPDWYTVLASGTVESHKQKGIKNKTCRSRPRRSRYSS
jgi:hypothetical protein